MVEQSSRAEMAVIGSLLIDPKCAGLVFEKLRPENFCDSTYRSLFAAARQVFLEGRPIDPVLVGDRAGSKSYEQTLFDIMRLTPTAANVEEYAQIVQEQSRLYRLNALGMELAGAKDYQEGLRLLARAEGLLTDNPGRRAFTYTEMIGEYLDRQSREEKPDYIDWGIEPLNRLKVSPGHFVVLAADSSVGKTALALQMALNVARSGKRVCFFSYETNQMDAIDRMLANAVNVNMSRSKEQRLTTKDIAAVNAEGAASERIPLTLIESGEYTLEELRAETLAGRYQVIFIDYLQLIPAPMRNKRSDEVADISRALRVMAQRLGVTIVALCQVTLPEKDSKGKRRRLTMDDVAESKQIKRDANEILILDYEEPGKRYGPRVLTVDKNKEGVLGQIRLGFDGEHMRFYPLKQNDQPQEAKAEKPGAVPGQRSFEELSEAQTGPLPF